LLVASARVRSATSVLPPAGHGTMSVTGRSGKPWAAAPAAQPQINTASTILSMPFMASSVPSDW
jgi:hypothetical protein